MNAVEAFLEHEQLHRRGRVKEVGSPTGPVMGFLPPVTIPGMTPVMGAVPGLGQHTEAILAELGLAEPKP
jgi:crotonobetainyl-CoA:carnitine CoA-transferase CaiB-like acyl-CoA transferase